MIVIEHVSKYFVGPSGRKIILNRANLRIPKRVCLGIQAPNGTGKTTVLNLLAGYERCNSGRIIRSGTVSPPLGLATGLIFDCSGRENIRLISKLNRCDPDKAETFVCWLTGMGRELLQPVRTMSLGMRARLTLSLLLVADFDTYLIDEGFPTTTDAAFNRKAVSCIKSKLKTSNLVLVSHQKSVIEKLCTHVVRLRNGNFSAIEAVGDAAMAVSAVSKIAA